MMAAHRHPGTRQLARYFSWIEVTGAEKDRLGKIRRDCEALAVIMIMELPDGPELTTGLRKLLEAKDCFVRAALP